MTKFFCTNCKYNLNAEKKPRTCPYCNEDKIEEEKSACEILQEVSDMLKE